jgi:hypothetical protein
MLPKHELSPSSDSNAVIVYQEIVARRIVRSVTSQTFLRFAQYPISHIC